MMAEQAQPTPQKAEASETEGLSTLRTALTQVLQRLETAIGINPRQDVLRVEHIGKDEKSLTISWWRAAMQNASKFGAEISFAGGNATIAWLLKSVLSRGNFRNLIFDAPVRCGKTATANALVKAVRETGIAWAQHLDLSLFAARLPQADDNTRANVLLQYGYEDAHLSFADMDEAEIDQIIEQFIEDGYATAEEILAEEDTPINERKKPIPVLFIFDELVKLHPQDFETFYAKFQEKFNKRFQGELEIVAMWGILPLRVEEIGPKYMSHLYEATSFAEKISWRDSYTFQQFLRYMRALLPDEEVITKNMLTLGCFYTSFLGNIYLLDHVVKSINELVTPSRSMDIVLTPDHMHQITDQLHSDLSRPFLVWSGDTRALTFPAVTVDGLDARFVQTNLPGWFANVFDTMLYDVAVHKFMKMGQLYLRAMRNNNEEKVIADIKEVDFSWNSFG